LNDSFLWKDARALSNAPMQPKLGSEWETWKHDVIKCFATFSSFFSNTEPQHALSSDSLLATIRTRSMSWLWFSIAKK
jgi:hypothetical protein